MDENTLVDGLMANSMEREHLLQPMDKKNKENGKMELENDGLSSIMILKWMI